MEFEPVDLLAIVLLLAVVIGSLNHLWVGLPPAIGMLLGALALSLLVVGSDHLLHLHIMSWFRGTLDNARLSRVFLNAILALLLFAGSLHVDVAELNRRRGIILLLATASVIISSTAFGGAMYYTFGLIGLGVPLVWCIVLGAILAPTDAVVVENLLRQMKLPPNLRATIIGESLFNDGAGVVLFLVALGVTQGERFVFGRGVVPLDLSREIGGGAVLGLAAGWLAAMLLRRVAEEGLQLLISLALVIGVYRVANLSELSGPIAVVCAGLCLASPSQRFGMKPATRLMLVGFWTLLDQLINTLLFLALGLQILGLVIAPIELVPIAFAVPLAVLTRLLSILLPLILTREKLLDKTREIAALTWAGLRGGISIALALSLPPSPWRAELLVVTYAVVIFTIVVQGLTLPWVLRQLYGAEPVPEEFQPEQ